MTTAYEKALEEIPGTRVFTTGRSRQGYDLNMFCASLMKPANRLAFKADERGYLSGWRLAPAQERAVLARDWNGMLELGGNVYYLARLAATDGLNFEQLAAQMTGMTRDAYAAMMLKGGRRPG